MQLMFNIIIKKNPIPLGEIGIAQYFSFSNKAYDAAEGKTDVWLKVTATKAVNITSLKIIKLSLLEIEKAVYPLELLN